MNNHIRPTSMRGCVPDEVIQFLNHLEEVMDQHPEMENWINVEKWNAITALTNAKLFHVSVQPMVESHQTTYVLTIDRFDRDANASVFDTEGRLTPYRTRTRENADSECEEWDAFLNGDPNGMTKFERLTARFDGRMNWTDPDA